MLFLSGCLMCEFYLANQIVQAEFFRRWIGDVQVALLQHMTEGLL